MRFRALSRMRPWGGLGALRPSTGDADPARTRTSDYDKIRLFEWCGIQLGIYDETSRAEGILDSYLMGDVGTIR